jgi:UDP-N-acetylmuramyl pentapeptide synthase
MLELGEKTLDFHLEIKKQLESLGVSDQVISVGKYTDCLGAKKHFLNVDEILESNFLGQVPKGSVLLLKASHGIHLEKLVERI